MLSTSVETMCYVLGCLVSSPGPALHVKDGEVFANSRDVVECFGKEHKNVLRDIHALIEATGSDLSWFIHAPYRDAKGETRLAWDLTRDGFILLVMGYTGPSAMKFKVAYINQFKAMEEAPEVQARPRLGSTLCVPRCVRDHLSAPVHDASPPAWGEIPSSQETDDLSDFFASF